jgi:hypothetical protein
MNIIMLLKVKRADITMMTSDMTSPVNLDFFAKTSRMRVAIGSLSASLTQPTMVRVQMEPGEEAQLSLTDTGSSTKTTLLDIGSVKTAKSLVTGPMMMAQPQLEHGGSKETVPGLEPGPLMILMIPSSMIALIMEIMKTTPALISMMAL